MNMEELVRKTRSYRRFHEDHAIGMEVLEGLVNLARLSASGRNLQPLKYMLCNQREMNARIFPELAWAGYLKEWPGPEAGERPSAYIMVLGDQRLTKDFGSDPPGGHQPRAGGLSHRILEKGPAPGDPGPSGTPRDPAGDRAGQAEGDRPDRSIGSGRRCQVLARCARGPPRAQAGPGGDPGAAEGLGAGSHEGTRRKALLSTLRGRPAPRVASKARTP